MKQTGIENLMDLQKHIIWKLDLRLVVFFFYFKGLYRLLDKERMNNHYNKILFSMFTDLEKKIYEFYGKKYPEQGPLTKWIIKNLK